MQSLQDFFDRLPPEAVIFTGRIGTGQNLNIVFRGVMSQAVEDGYKASDKDTIQTFVYSDGDRLVEDCLETAQDAGWGLEHEILRFQSYTIDRKPIKSKVLRKEIELDIDKEDREINAIQALTHANIRMTEEMRRGYREVVQNNREHLETIRHLTEAFVMSKREMLDLERENMAKELVMKYHDDEQGDDTRAQGLALLEKVVGGFFQQQAANIDDIIKETIKSDPSKVKDFMNDPEIMEAIMKAATEEEE